MLVVQEDPQLGEAFRDGLRDWGANAECVRTLREATGACAQPYELLVLDAELPDGSGVTLAELASRMRPAPLILAVTSDTAAREAFSMARLGAVAHMTKPATVAQLIVEVEQLLARPPDFMPHLIAAVGRVNFREVLDRVRRSMAEQALAMAAGNKTGAARLLGITRQAVQQLIRDLELGDGTSRPSYDSVPPADPESERGGSEPEASRVQ